METQPTDMSMSVRCDGCGLEYAGAKGLGGIFAQSANAANPRFLRMLVEVKRFHRAARRLLDGDGDPQAPDGGPLTLGDFLAAGNYTPYFRRHFMVPLVSCVWSCAPRTALLYPARSLFTFLDHHGALSVTGSPAWRTVVGGSRSYVERAAKELTATELSTPVRSVGRTPTGIEIRDDADDLRSYDAAVVATHADDALGLLVDPTATERATLGAFSSSVNETVLHTDGRVLPTHPRARASWNYLLDHCASSADEVHVSYDMNRLHRLDETRRLRRHPQPRPSGRRSAGARAHAVHAPGVHRGLGGGAGVTPELEWRPPRVRRCVPRVGLPRGRLPLRGARRVGAGGGLVRPRLYRTRVAHGRTERVRHGFTYRHATWLVDLDDVPVLRASAARAGALRRPRPPR